MIILSHGKLEEKQERLFYSGCSLFCTCCNVVYLKLRVHNIKRCFWHKIPETFFVRLVDFPDLLCGDQKGNICHMIYYADPDEPIYSPHRTSYLSCSTCTGEENFSVDQLSPLLLCDKFVCCNDVLVWLNLRFSRSPHNASCFPHKSLPA